MKNTLPVKIEHGELKIPLSSMSLNRVKADNATSVPDRTRISRKVTDAWFNKKYADQFFSIMVLTAILFGF